LELGTLVGLGTFARLVLVWGLVVDIEIEFTDPHTLVIKGHTDREYNSNNGNNDATSSLAVRRLGGRHW
jgi:hypothetical protein